MTMTNTKIKKAIAALKPLEDIWKAYLANELDDGARRFWGINLENENKVPPEDIQLYGGRGGKELLTLAHCREAAASATMLRKNLSKRGDACHEG